MNIADQRLIYSAVRTSEKENSTISVGIEVACKMCYIKGTVEAKLNVPGDGDVVDLFIDYQNSINETINDITTKALGPVKNGLTQGTEKFVNVTTVFQDQINSITEEALNKSMEFVNSKIFGVVERTVEEVFDRVKDYLNEKITGLKPTATNFQAEIENIANKAVEETKEFFNRFDILPWDNLDKSFNDFADDLLGVFKKGFEKVSSELEEAFPLDVLQFPTIDIDFNLPDIDPIPDLTLSFALDDLELYLDLEVTLTAEATYTLPLFRSQSSLGMALPDAYAGAVVAIDLVLTSEAEVELQSGFHLKVDGSILLDIGMFAQNMS